jgi:spore maturation protein CgeB
MRILYSFNKRGFEETFWTREIAAASSERYTFIPFNHDPYVDVSRYGRAQLLDNLYFDKHPGLMRLYEDFAGAIERERADAVIVDNAFPYHPDFLRTLPVYKVLRTTDGPITAYDRDFAYLHAYDHVLFHTPAYSRDMGMAEKLRYAGAKNADLWPLALFDAAFDPGRTEETIPAEERDVDVVFVGAHYPGKMALLARVKKAFGRRAVFRGLASVKWNLYYNAKFGFPGVIRALPFQQYVPLYQRARIGINVHNRGDYTVGNYRLFELPGNGVMQISDGGANLNEFFDLGNEVVGFSTADDLVEKIRFYLNDDAERRRIALNGWRRVMKDHRLKLRLQQGGALIEQGMTRVGWKRRTI